MCGICGVIDFKGKPIDQKEFLRQTNILSHRGPNDAGVFLDKNAALGSRRLSIIDLETGNQPIHNEDKTIWVVCNGEIYNYRELAQSLKAKGHVFYTRSDTEVIIHLYEEYQEKCVEYLNGIFAFAIWDKKLRKLLLVRDRLGVKPLFYYHDHNKLLFGSEIKAILHDSAIKREVNQEALNNYFSFNYVPCPLTMFKNIHSLPAGYMLICSDKNVRISKYWDMVFKEGKVSDENEIYERLRAQIDKSVRMQLVSDVDVGAFLSGGIDSSAIVRFMRKNLTRSIKTFNVRFKESTFDESSYAALVSKYFGTRHYEIFCTPQDYINYLPNIIWHADNLTADISMLPLYLVSKLASQHVKVVLSGDGADELFAGYPTYLASKLLGYYQKLPAFLRQRVIPFLVNRMPVSEKKMSFEFKVRRFIQGARLSPQEAHFSWRMIFSDEEKGLLFGDSCINDKFRESSWIYGQFYQNNHSWEELSRHQYADIKVWLVDSILAKVDFMSMANSLEVRVPYLDHELVEFAASIPSNFKLKRFTGKYIMKKAMRDEIPKAVLRRAKAGFNIPIGRWLRTELKGLMTDVLSCENIKRIGFLNHKYVKELINDHLEYKKDNGYKILSLLHFSCWYDTFINSKSVREDVNAAAKAV